MLQSAVSKVRSYRAADDMPQLIAADPHPCADRSAVCTALVAWSWRYI